MENKTAQLDSDQTKVATFLQGHALVMAGAGSGKTTAIVRRCVNLIASGVNPESILMMTFTNKAAKEMLERTEKILQEEGLPNKLPNITTFHSFGHKLIRKNYALHYRDRNPSLIDPKDVNKMLHEYLNGIISHDKIKPALELYSYVRNEGLDSNVDSDRLAIQAILKKNDFSDQDARYTILAWQEYENEKSEFNLLDYDDLVNLPIVALRENPAFREKVQRYLSHVIIDESQDNNESQFKFLLEIAPPNSPHGASTMLVGDSDQSINGWRGAHPENMMRYKEAYHADILLMENNYRSLPDIVERAASLIEYNNDRLEKKAISMRKNADIQPDPIFAEEAKDGDAMFKAVVENIKTALATGTQPNEIAILYRMNKIAGLIEPYLINADIPYQVKSGIALLEKPEVRMMLSLARLAMNPKDILAFEYLCDMIPGVGKKRVDGIIANLREGEGATLSSISSSIKGKAGEAIQRWDYAIKQLRIQGPTEILKFMNHDHFKSWLTKRIETNMKASNKYKPDNFDLWQKKKLKQSLTQEEMKIVNGLNQNDCEIYWAEYAGKVSEAMGRLKLVQSSIRDRVDSSEIKTIEDQWAEMMEMIARPPDEDNEAQPKITLGTMHGAKGAEWEHVHLVAFSENIAPMANRDKGIDDIEEERNLAYVGMTRAKNCLRIYSAKKIDLKMGLGEAFYQPSRFIYEAGLSIHRDITAPENKAKTRKKVAFGSQYLR